MAEIFAESGEEDGMLQRASPLFVRYVANSEGSKVGVPVEWLDKPVGEVFDKPVAPSMGPKGPRRMVEVVEVIDEGT